MKRARSELEQAVLEYARKAARESSRSRPSPPEAPHVEEPRLTPARKSRIVAALKRLHPMD